MLPWPLQLQASLSLIGSSIAVQRRQPLSKQRHDLLTVRTRSADSARAETLKLRDCSRPWVDAIQQFLCKCSAAGQARAVQVAGESDAQEQEECQGTIFDDDMTLQELKDLTCRTHKHGSNPSPAQGLRPSKNGGLLVACHSNGLILDPC